MSTSYSLAKAQSCQTFNQNLVLLFVFSFSYFVKAKFGAFVRPFGPLGQFQFTFVFKIPFRHFVCFGKIINCTAVPGVPKKSTPV
jgi:hypothetical protein